jgi:hypothetical protein
MPSLFFHADDPLWQPQRTDALVALLQQLGLLGSETELNGSGRYFAGDGFLQLLMFLGCSPQVALAPGAGAAGQAMCFIRLLVFDGPVFLLARPLPAVRCSQCRANASLPTGFTCMTRWCCSECGTTVRVADLDWRQGAGCASFFIEVHGVHPQEAIPSDKLLQELGRFSHSNWKYFFADSPSRLA